MDLLDFLGVSQGGVAGVLLVVLFFVMLYFLGHLPKKKFSFAVRVLMGTGAGTAVGLVVRYALPEGLSGDLGRWFYLVARGYTFLFVAILLPLVFLASARLAIRDKTDKEHPERTKCKKWVNTLMVMVSAVIALSLGLYFRIGALPGSGVAVFDWNSGLGAVDSLSSILPAGLGRDLLLGNVIGVFVFGIYVGKAALRMSGKHMDQVKPVLDLVEAAFSTGVSVSKTIIGYKPMGAAAIMAYLMNQYGLDMVYMLVKMLLVLCLGCLVMLLFQTLLCAICGVGPGRFFGKGKDVMLKALKTRSASECLSDAQAVLSEGLGLDQEVTDEVARYAVASGMQGCGALFPATAAVFALGLYGVTMTPGAAVMMVLVIVLASYGITDLPGTATMGEFAAVMGVGLTDAAPCLGAMIALDPIGDVPRTLINVTGCMTNAIIVERRVKK